MGCGCGSKKVRRLSLGSLLGDPYLSGGLGDDSFAAKLLTREPYVTLGKLINTVGDARVALGKAAELYRQGFIAAEDVSRLAGARDQARDQLTQGNNYAMRVYSELPSNAGAALDVKSKAKVVEAMKEAIDNLNGVGELMSIRLDLLGALKESLGNILGLPAYLVPKILPGVKWWHVALGLGATAGAIVAARRFIK